MKLGSVSLAFILGSLGVIASSMSAQALDFNWSFTDQNSGKKVTGFISGLNEGTNDWFNNQSIGVSVLSTPDGQGANYNFVNPHDYQWDGSFIVTNGEISYADALIYDDDQTVTFSSNPQVATVTSFPQYFNTQFTYYFANTDSGNSFTASSATAVPFDFNPTEGVALGLPLFLGLGMLRKKKLAQKSVTKKVAELVS